MLQILQPCKKIKNYMLLDVGVFHFPGLPFVSHTMFHEVISPNKIIHFSKRRNSAKYVKSEVNFVELSENKLKLFTNIILICQLFISF